MIINEIDVYIFELALFSVRITPLVKLDEEIEGEDITND